MLGALVHYVTHAEIKSFQPMKANFGILPPPEHRLKKQERYQFYAERSARTMTRFIRSAGIVSLTPKVANEHDQT
jgi:methylenetetrahydrofolate--tRNA-(uracil-5-)-methyltransferase